MDRLTLEGTRCFAVTIALDNPGALIQGMKGATWLMADCGDKLYPAVEGSLEYKSSKTVTAQAAGELLTVHVDAYEKVTAEQVLFTIDDSDYTDQIEDAEKGIANAQKGIETARERIASYTQRMEETEVRLQCDQQDRRQGHYGQRPGGRDAPRRDDGGGDCGKGGKQAGTALQRPTAAGGDRLGFGYPFPHPHGR